PRRSSDLPGLALGTRVVLAGRYPSTHLLGAGSRWQSLIDVMPLAAFGAEEAREYLRRRGVTAVPLVEQILSATAGSPLALSLAADLVRQHHVRRFAPVPEWRLAVRRLVDRLLRDVRDPELRDLLQACAVVRHFEEPTLAALTETAQGADAFDRLCRLSVVRATTRGLALHDDVRRALTDDLRWRAAERHRDLRLRALAYYQERA